MSETQKEKAAAMPTTGRMTMVERVARALCAKRNAHLGSPDAETLVRGKPNWVFHVPDALTAIEAMREPTPGMVEAARLEGSDDPDNEASSTGHYWVREEMWQAMIDAALSEDPLPETKGVAAA